MPSWHTPQGRWVEGIVQTFVERHGGARWVAQRSAPGEPYTLNVASLDGRTRETHVCPKEQDDGTH